MFLANHPRNIPAAFHKPIGQILTRWSVTELYVQSIVWHVWGIKDPKTARMLTWDLPAVSKAELFRQLSPRWVVDTSQRSELKAIADEVDQLRVKRNRVAHGTWGFRPGDRKTLYLINASRKMRLRPKAEPVVLADLKSWAKQLDALNQRLISFHKKLGAPPP